MATGRGAGRRRRCLRSALAGTLLLATALLGERAAAAAPATVAPKNGDELVFLLQYVGADYPLAVREARVANPVEYTEMLVFTRSLADDYAALRGAAATPAIREGLERLRALVEERAAAEQVRTLVHDLTPRLAEDLGVATQPVGPLDPARGRELYAAACAACHGSDGAGTGFAAAAMDPRPTSFLEPRMAHLSPHQIVGAMRFGIAGTAMPSFDGALSAEDRWNVATYVWNLRGTDMADPRLAGEHGRGDRAAGPRITTAGAAAPANELAPELASALALEAAFANVADLVFPSVATVSAYLRDDAPGDASGAQEGAGWREAGPRSAPYPGMRLVRSRSGFFVSDDGYLLTNYGAVAPFAGREVDVIDVEIARERRRARLVGAEPTVDLAVLKVDLPFATRPVALPSEESVAVGRWAIAVGDPPGPERTFSTGTISAMPERECYQEQRGATLVQTSCRLDPESYGGPVADIEGRVFGISVPRPGGEGPAALAAFTRQAQVLPIGLAMTLYDALRARESRRSPWLGFSVLELTRDRRTRGGPRTGVFIDDVFEPSPAAAAGVEVGDVLTAIDDRRILSVADFQTALYLAGVGKQVTLHLSRQGRALSLPVPVEERPPAARPRDPAAE